MVAPAAIGAISEVRKIRVRKIAFRMKITVCPSLGLRPTEAKAFQLLPRPSHRKNGCVTDDCSHMFIEDYILFVVSWFDLQ